MFSPNFVPQMWTFLLREGLNLVAAIIILAAGWTLANIVTRWIRSALVHARHFDPTLKPIAVAVGHYAILGLTIMAVLERFGIRTTSLIAILGAAGLAVGLALQGTLSNVASGVMLLMLRSFRVGDEIASSGYVGTVREIGLFRTVLITGDGLYVSIPNATVFSAPIVNNSREPTRLVSFKIAIDHTSDIDKAQKLILEVLHSDPRILKSPPPGATVAELGDYDVILGVTGWTMSSAYGAALSDLQRNVRQKMREAGISPPRRVVSVGAPAASPVQAAAADLDTNRGAARGSARS